MDVVCLLAECRHSECDINLATYTYMNYNFHGHSPYVLIITFNGLGISNQETATCLLCLDHLVILEGRKSLVPEGEVLPFAPVNSYKYN